MVLFGSVLQFGGRRRWAVTRPLLAPRSGRAGIQSTRARRLPRPARRDREPSAREGLLGGAEAEGARIELARRLHPALGSKAATPPPAIHGGTRAPPGASSMRRRAAGARHRALSRRRLAADCPARPYAARLDIARSTQATAAISSRKVEAHLREHPEDGRGWDVLAPVYMRMGDYTQAADAYQKASRLLGELPQRLAGFARALDHAAERHRQRAGAGRRIERLLCAGAAMRSSRKVWLAHRAASRTATSTGRSAEYRTLTAGAAMEPWKGLLEVSASRLVASAAGRRQRQLRHAEPGAAPAQSAPPEPCAGAIAPGHEPGASDKPSSSRWSRGSRRASKTNGKDLDGWMRLVRAYRCWAAARCQRPRSPARADNSPAIRRSLAQLKHLAQSLGSAHDAACIGNGNDAEAEARRSDRRAVSVLTRGGRPRAVRAARHHRLLPHAERLVEKPVAAGQRFRLGGLVAAGSVKRGEGTKVEFVVTDTLKDDAGHLRGRAAGPVPRRAGRRRRRQADAGGHVRRRQRAGQARRELHAARGCQGPEGERASSSARVRRTWPGST